MASIYVLKTYKCQISRLEGRHFFTWFARLFLGLGAKNYLVRFRGVVFSSPPKAQDNQPQKGSTQAPHYWTPTNPGSKRHPSQPREPGSGTGQWTHREDPRTSPHRPHNAWRAYQGKEKGRTEPESQERWSCSSFPTPPSPSVWKHWQILRVMFPGHPVVSRCGARTEFRFNGQSFFYQWKVWGPCCEELFMK